MYQFYFEKLRVWKESKNMSLKIYRLTSQFPKDEKFSLTSQMRRSAISISANIAEGSSRITIKDKVHFTTMSYSSLMELYNLITLAYDLNYIE